MKRVVLFLIAIVAFTASVKAYDFSYTYQGKTLYYNIVNGNAEAVRPGTHSSFDNYVTGNLTIPSSVTYCGTNYTVTIGNSAFYNCSGLTSVTIGDSVTSIGGSAFSNCSGLTSVTIPNSVIFIGASAFSGCSGLTSVSIGNSVTSIGSNAFNYCSSLTSVNYTGTIAQWCNIFFNDYLSNPIYYSHSLSVNSTPVTDLIIPDGVTSIGDYAFNGCSGLISVTIPNSVTSIGNSAFSGCSGLTSVTIGNSVTTIGHYAFSRDSNIVSLTIPSSVTSIGTSVFSGCSGLTSITIGNSVTTVGPSAFSGCSGLTSVNYTGTIAQWCNIFFNDYTSNPISYSHSLSVNSIPVTDLIIPDSVTSIGNYAFAGCSSLTSVIVGNSVTTINNSAFSNCNGLTSVTIGNSVTSIGSNAFYNCSGLTSANYTGTIAQWCNIYFNDYLSNPIYYSHLLSVNSTPVTDLIIPDGVTSIGLWAFIGCSSFTSVTISNSVTTIGHEAFAGCSGVTSVNYTGTIAQWCNITFNSATSNPIYYSHSLSINNIPISNLIIPDGATSIGEYAFAGCSSLISVTIPNSVTSIGDYAFWDCSSNMEVFIKATTPPSLGNIAFCYSDNNSIHPYTLIVPRGSIGSYRSANQWSALQDSIFVDSCQMTLVNANPTLGTAAIRDTNVMTLLCPYKEARWFDSYDVTEHYHTQWTWDQSNKKDSSSVEFVFKVKEDTFTLMCDFVVDTYYVNVVANDITRGSVSGGGEFVYGTPCTVEATAYTGYTFHSWSNGVTANPYVFVPVEDMTLTAIFLAPGEGIGSVDGMDAKVNCDRGQIVVEGAEGNTVTLFDINGRLLERKKESGERRTFDVPASGAYLIKIGNHPARKVVVIR